ncbi:MAG: MmgE/PrpD family protein [Chloroflexi bacterium]|nr:MmgE/PrpD family protein [Chloroflexota bacterium]
MAIRDQLADFSCSLRFEDLPRDVVEFTRLFIRDQVGSTAVAARIDPERELQVDVMGLPPFFRQMGGTKESSLVPEGCKVPCINAAFANTVLSFGAFDSTHHASSLHLSSCVIPATMAVAEREHASGKDLILATVVGCEIMARVGMGLGSGNAYGRGFHPTAICTPIGCAVAAGKLLGLERDILAEAISIAAVQGAGAPPLVQPGRSPFAHRVSCGRAAQGGVLAALLAQMGVVGISAVFEGPRGFLAAHSGNPDPAKLTENLGKVYEIKHTTCSRFGVGGPMVPGIETLFEVLRKNQIRAEDIERITCQLATAHVALVGSPAYPSVDGSGSVSRSMRYMLAFAAYKGEAGTEFTRQFKSEANVKDPRHIELFKRIDVVADPDLDKLYPATWPCILTLKTKDGREFRQGHNGWVKGTPENPFTPEERENRFTKVVASVLPKRRCDRMLEILRRLEEVDDVSDLAALIAARWPNRNDE